MIKVYLSKVVQGSNDPGYVGKAPARTLAAISYKPDFGAMQDAQRPIKESRLHELAKFVTDDVNGGMLSLSVVLGTKNDKITLHETKTADGDDLFYIELPETKSECDEYKDSIDVMDGQHRVFSFGNDICQLPDSVDFDLTFIIYFKPSLKLRRLIFKNTNEKQEAVSPNLLAWFRAQLNMLQPREEKYYNIVNLLATDPSSPLNGRVIMAAERIIGGIKANQLILILDRIDLKGKVSSILGSNSSDDKIFSILKKYLGSWEREVQTTFAARDKQFETFSKIAGVRYILGLLPYFFDVAARQQKHFNEDFIRKQIRNIYNNGHWSMSARDFFDKTSEYNINQEQNFFSSENTTWTLVAQHGAYLQEICNNDGAFNIFED